MSQAGAHSLQDLTLVESHGKVLQGLGACSMLSSRPASPSTCALKELQAHVTLGSTAVPKFGPFLKGAVIIG